MGCFLIIYEAIGDLCEVDWYASKERSLSFA
jgi:hypothetical protein